MGIVHPEDAPIADAKKHTVGSIGRDGHATHITAKGCNRHLYKGRPTLWIVPAAIIVVPIAHIHPIVHVVIVGRANELPARGRDIGEGSSTIRRTVEVILDIGGELKLRLVLVDVAKCAVTARDLYGAVDASGRKLLRAIVLRSSEVVVGEGGRVNGASIELRDIIIVALEGNCRGDGVSVRCAVDAPVIAEIGNRRATRLKNHDMLIGMDVLEAKASIPMCNLRPSASAITRYKKINTTCKKAVTIERIDGNTQVIPCLAARHVSGPDAGVGIGRLGT